MKNYDVIIVGAGPGGLTAAIYAIRYNLKVLMLGKIPGGLATTAHEIWNFPSRKRIIGSELMFKMMNQVKELGVDIKSEEVLDVKKERLNGNLFTITTTKEKYSTKNIILATGTQKRKLGLKKERRLTGKGIHYCATCDGAFYKDKFVAIIGGCDSALNSLKLLKKYAKKIYIINKGKNFCRKEIKEEKKLLRDNKIEILFDEEIINLIGNTKLKGIELKSGKKIKLDGLFIEIGSMPSISLAKKLGVKMKDNQIIVDKNQRTNIKGIFAAGDVTDTPLKQIITACGDGAKAAYGVYQNLKE